MSHNWVFIKSPHYRRFIERSRENRWVFWGATAGLFAVAVTAANVTMELTNPGLDEEAARDHSDKLSKLPMHTQAVARKNREHLRAMVRDVAAGNDKARYRAMLDGKIHGTTHGTSMPTAAAGAASGERQ
ncbi:hypothetical protein Rsub_06225 [Raphidocelis subcapitata]|uniref:Uncharacterized protein n=1 Tax=Raphidocelis subcapitata TaxID=307507 RepID=A0A2V0P281_9CHLO|nr:hypothetical protein Rsub_06225 [Raphidocelis subcapitata]|eukprot:GBF93976.1 hypothetical protein Rsub_06225 [Raphidocelis subcapitata]